MRYHTYLGYEYKIFICTGDREVGSYTVYANNYAHAATKFGNQWNTNTCSSLYGTTWRNAGRRDGLPTFHRYMTDNKGNTILLVMHGQ